MIIGLLAIVGAVWLGSRLAPTGQPVAASSPFALGGYLLLIALGWIWLVYNSLVNLRQRVRQSWRR